MARVIDDDCINCGICVKFCPVGAIKEGKKHMEVDKEKCIDCYACEIECPKKAAYFG